MSNLTPYAWVETLRSYKGTKFHHQGRSGKRGLDCVGLCVVAATEIGVAHGAEKIGGYSRTPNNYDFDYWTKHFTVKQPYNRLQPFRTQVKVGDLVTFWIDRRDVTRHIGVITEAPSNDYPTMIHSYARENRGVMEIQMNSYWTARVTGIYRLREFCEEE